LLSCIFEMETSFVDNAANFITHGNWEKAAISVLLRGTIDKLLLSIVKGTAGKCPLVLKSSNYSNWSAPGWTEDTKSCWLSNSET
jgi:hypothetical protein